MTKIKSLRPGIHKLFCQPKHVHLNIYLNNMTCRKTYTNIFLYV